MKLTMIEGKGILKENIIEQICNIYFDARYDFEPDLYKRNKVDNDKELKLIIRNIFLERIINNNNFILIEFENKIVGFNNHNPNGIEVIEGKEEESVIVGTTCILKEYRNMGIGKKLYEFMDDLFINVYKKGFAVRRTWSTNNVQKVLYEKNKYQLLERKTGWYGIKDLDMLVYYKKF